MSVPIRYYNTFVYKKGVKTRIDFTEVLDKINEDLWGGDQEYQNNNWGRRVRQMGNKVGTLFKPEETYKSRNDNNIMIIPIGQFRLDDKPYTADISAVEYEQLPSNIVELTTFVIYKNELLLILQHNYRGFEKNDIENYFNTYLPESYELKLEPIISKQSLELIEKTNQITEIYIELEGYLSEVIEMNKKLNKEGQEKRNLLSFFIDLISKLNQGKEDFNANKAGFVYKVNDPRSETMNLKSIKNLANLVNLEDEGLSKFELRIRNERGNLECINLVEQEVELRDYISKKEDKPAPPIISDRMLENRELHRKTISKNLEISHHEKVNVFEVDVPELSYNPRPENSYKKNEEDEEDEE